MTIVPRINKYSSDQGFVNQIYLSGTITGNVVAKVWLKRNHHLIFFNKNIWVDTVLEGYTAAMILFQFIMHVGFFCDMNVNSIISKLISLLPSDVVAASL
ncbi:hypothetical protein ACJX0J_007363 [Zea mays]